MDCTVYLVMIVLILTEAVKESLALECYTCTSSPSSQCTSTTTCAAGQVCSNAVIRRFMLGVVHTKGCEDRDLCNSLKNLNDDRYCSTVPSQCVYCCSGDLCNGVDGHLSSVAGMVVMLLGALVMTL